MEVVFPNELLIALKEEPEGFRQKVLLCTIGKLYELGRISGGFGAKIPGCTRWDFYRALSENGFAVIDYPDEELEREGRTLISKADSQSSPNLGSEFNSTQYKTAGMV